MEWDTKEERIRMDSVREQRKSVNWTYSILREEFHGGREEEEFLSPTMEKVSSFACSSLTGC